MHHGHGGYGRYYDSPGCRDAAHGCDARIAEPLSRDAFTSSFPITPELPFPLTLRLSACNVFRTGEGAPSVFVTFYSPTGGVPRTSWIDGLLSWLFVPIMVMVFCAARALGSYLAASEEEEEEEERERRDVNA